MSDITNRTILKYIFSYVKTFKLILVFMVFVASFWAVEQSLVPYLVKIMIDRMTEYQGGSTSHIIAPMVIYLIFYIVMSSCFRLYSLVVETKMIPIIRKRIGVNHFEHLLGQSHTYYQDNFAGNLASKINDLTNNIPSIIQLIVDRFLQLALVILIAIGTLFYVNPKFGVILTGWICLFLFVFSLFYQKIEDAGYKFSDLVSKNTGYLVDVFTNILSVRLFASKNLEQMRVNQTYDEIVATEKKLRWTQFWVWFTYGYSFCLMQALNLYFLYTGWIAGTVSVGDFALVLGISQALGNSLWMVALDLSNFTEMFGRIKQAYQLLKVNQEIVDQNDALKLQVDKGEIRFEHVSFHYKGTEPLFKDKSVDLTPGGKVGLVGYSGSGKTTFVNLILRLYDIRGGKILVDGQSIAEVTQESLRSEIAMIPQDPALFHRTIMENIRYGRSDASDEEVRQAAILAHADEFIAELPKGYETMVGERGIKLSGGQRQRIAIARAFLKRAKILILDEATSQLDSLTEELIQDSLKTLMKGKTTIIVAHRLSTLLNMDRILVFDKGRIIEDGSHEQLLHQDGLYAKLWRAQVGGFLGDEEEHI